MQPCVGREFSVINSNPGRRNIGVSAIVHLSQILGVAVDRFFLQIAHGTVRDRGRNQVNPKVKVEEDPLGKPDQQVLKPGRLGPETGIPACLELQLLASEDCRKTSISQLVQYLTESQIAPILSVRRRCIFEPAAGISLTRSSSLGTIASIGIVRIRPGQLFSYRLAATKAFRKVSTELPSFSAHHKISYTRICFLRSDS